MTKRRVIKAADIEAFFGVAPRQARRLLKDVKIEYHKKKHQPATVS